MPWQEVSTMALRQEFVTLAQQEGANIRALCRSYGISPQTGYTWLAREQSVLRVFTDPGCGPCTSLLPDLACWQCEGGWVRLPAWQRTGASPRMMPALVSSASTQHMTNDAPLGPSASGNGLTRPFGL